MKRLLAVGLSLAMVLGLAAGSFALDSQKILAPASQLQSVEQSIGGIPTKDECWMWMDQLSGWIWIWYASWFGPGCGFKKYIDPYEGYTDCYPPYFPFYQCRQRWAMHTYLCPYYNSVTVEFDKEELGEFDAGLGCYRPGPEIYNTGPVTYNLPPGWYGYLVITHPRVRLDGPFFDSFHLVSADYLGYFEFGYLTDAYNGATPCWNWLDGSCIGYGYLEFYNELGWTEGDLLVDAIGKADWNIAVDMGSFEAVPGDRMVTLNWQTLTEIDNASWTVSRNGEEIATLEGQGSKETPTDYSYVDRGLTNGETYSYTIAAINYEGNTDEYGPITATPQTSGVVPSEFALSQNYPNPFNASTVIRYQLASDEHVTLKVYNVSGQEVASLVDADQKAGTYAVHWTGKGVSSGVYFYTLSAGDFSQTKKMVFTK